MHPRALSCLLTVLAVSWCPAMTAPPESATTCSRDRDITPLLGKLEQMARSLTASPMPCLDLKSRDVDALTPQEDDALAACTAVAFIESYQRERQDLCQTADELKAANAGYRLRETLYQDRIALEHGNAEMFRDAWQQELGAKGGGSGRKLLNCLIGGHIGLNFLPAFGGAEDGEDKVPGSLGLSLSCGVPIL